MRKEKELGIIEFPPEFLKETKEKTKNIPDLKKEIENSLSKNITDLLNLILAGTIAISGSDIHIEPQKDEARLRLRIDGMLQDVFTFETSLYESLIKRIKITSKVKLNITDKPQDGRFTIKNEEEPIEIRTSILPAEYGESVVMRILNPKSLISLEELGLREDLMETFKKEIKRKNGMIIVTGPTGSGKTTTLYAFLKYLSTPEIKIITIENPIEYHLKGVSQTQVDPGRGYTFADGLRSIVRQDPDVILVGEIRDLETAEIALQAALTGHLVLTTLHTNDAAGTIPRIIDLGANPSSIAPAINMAIAQRLLRKVCKECAIERKLKKEELEEIKSGLKNLSQNVKLPEINENTKIPQAKGCKDCNQTGYRGRTGAFESFMVNEEIEEIIHEKPTVSEMRKQSIAKGMITMYQSALIETLKGITTLEEVKRVMGK